jgi:hypothetical protein
MDIFWQLLFLDGVFHDEADILLSAFQAVRFNKIFILFAPKNEEKKNIFKSFLMSDLVRSKLPDMSNNYEAMIEEVLSRVFVMKMPVSLSGLTLCNRSIIIKKHGDSIEDFLCWGLTLVTVLHELGHFAQRFYLVSDKMWLEHSSPKRATNDSEAGTDLEEKIFGYSLDSLTLEGTNFLFDPANWLLPGPIFQKEFSSKNVWNRKYKHKPGEIRQQARTKGSQLEFDGNARHIGSCFTGGPDRKRQI